MTPSVAHRDAWIEIDLHAIVANALAVRSVLPIGTQLMAIVKADAYGHGAVPASLALQAAGLDAFGVATLDEGIALRDGGVTGRIIVLYDVPPDALRDAFAAGLELSAGSIGAIQAIVGAAPTGWRAVHLKIDSGMTRQGLLPEQIHDNADVLSAAAEAVIAIWTHLRDGADADASRAQRATFAAAVNSLAAVGIHGERHVSASAAILAGSVEDEEMVRLGLALYGAVPDELIAAGGTSPVPLRPAMAVHARPIRIVQVPAGTQVGYGGTFVTPSSSQLATLPLGYADGIPRALGNSRGSALVRGRRVPIVGRVSMDSLVVDVTDVPDLDGAVFTLLGGDPADGIRLERLAAEAGTIPQEIAVRLNARLPRIYP